MDQEVTAWAMECCHNGLPGEQGLGSDMSSAHFWEPNLGVEV